MNYSISSSFLYNPRALASSLRRSRVPLPLVLTMALLGPGTASLASGKMLTVSLNQRAHDPWETGQGDWAICEEKAGQCRQFLFQRVEPDEKIQLPDGKSIDNIRFLTVRNFRKQGIDALTTIALEAGTDGDSLWMDFNNDEDLGNDGSTRFWPQGDLCTNLGLKEKESGGSLNLCRVPNKKPAWQSKCESMKNKITWVLCEEAFFQVQVEDIVFGYLPHPKTAGKNRKIGLADMDADGKFQLSASDRLLFDWDGDDLLGKSMEKDAIWLVRTEESPLFSWEGATYRIADVDLDGRSLKLEKQEAYSALHEIIKPVEGKRAPDLEFMTLNGDSLKLSGFKGKKILLNFWSVGCQACLGEMEDIKHFSDTYDDKNWQVISLTTDKDLEMVEKMARAKGMTWIVGLVGARAKAYFGPQGLPALFKIDSNGILVKKQLKLGVGRLNSSGHLKPEIGLRFRKTVQGYEVVRVLPDSPAGRAGMRPKDVLVGLNRDRLHDADDLIFAIRSAPAGSSLELNVYRDGKVISLNVEPEIKISM